MATTPEQLLETLKNLDISYVSYTHPPLFTVEESHSFNQDISGGHCKNLFLKDKKGVLWLIVCLQDTLINMKILKTKIESAHLSFGKPELLFEVLGVTPGSVTPFSIINDIEEHRVNLILDATMMAHEELSYHPLTNEQTITIAKQDLLRFIAHCGHQPRILDLS